MKFRSTRDGSFHKFYHSTDVFVYPVKFTFVPFSSKIGDCFFSELYFFSSEFGYMNKVYIFPKVKKIQVAKKKFRVERKLWNRVRVFTNFSAKKKNQYPRVEGQKSFSTLFQSRYGVVWKQV